MIYNRITILLLILLLTGCDNSGEKSTVSGQNGSDSIITYSIDQAPAYTINLEKRATVKEDQENPMFGWIAGFAVSELGEMFVADGVFMAVYVFDSSGKYIKRWQGKVEVRGR